MPRYFFQLQDGQEKLHDADGEDFASAIDARSAMTAVMCDIASATLPDRDKHVFKAELRDATGQALYRASLTLEGDWLKQPG